MSRLAAEALAELVPCAVEAVERIDALGFLSRAEDGLYPPSDVHVVRLMAAQKGDYFGSTVNVASRRLHRVTRP